MSKSNRGAYFAIRLVVGVGVSIAFLVWSFPGFRNPTYQQERYYNAENHESGEDNPVIRPSLWETYTSPTDTYAQWIMAVLSVAATGVSIWAVKLVRTTLDINRRATEAAESAVAVSREIGQAQVRAYLSCIGAVYGFEHDWFQCRAKLINSGQSPAKNIKIAATVGVFTNSGWVRSEAWEGGCEVIPAGGERHALLVWSHTGFDPALYEDLVEKDWHFSVDCRITWADVFEEEQTTTVFLSPHVSGLAVWRDEDFSRSGELNAYNQRTDRVDRG